MASRKSATHTGGRPATTGVIPGDYVLSVGNPNKPTPNGWAWMSLTDVARLESGHTPSRNHPEYWNGDIPWIGIRDATENHGRIIYDTQQHTNELGIANSSARLLPANTVCLSRTASVGFVVVMGCPMATSQDFVNWVCSDKIDHTFLKYVLISEKEAFLRFASGTTHQTVYYPEVKAFYICLPPKPTQKAIAHILGTLDEKIELLRSTNETLEAMVRALFKSWFIDFDPVRKKAEGQPSGLPPEIDSLFPDSFEDSELGEMPKGWATSPLSSWFGFLPGYAFKSTDWQDSGVPVIKIGSVKPGFVDLSQVSFVSDSVAAKADRYRLQTADLVIGMTGYVGEVGLVPFTDNLPLLNQRVGKFLLKKEGIDELGFLYCLTRRGEFKTAVETHSHGTAQANVSADGIMSIKAIFPQQPIYARFNRECKYPLNQLIHNKLEMSLLEQTRNFLLPNLISGELELSDKAISKILESAK
jgi:type I restriction enzyme S subunit